MEPFTTLDAVVLPLPIPNVDTDQIIPARFLWRKRNDGWSHLLFHDLRFKDDGSPKPDFVLNQPIYQGARILVADRNFGCGSSREHAVWSLYDYGFRAVIAPSFGDIFQNNSYQNGLLPVTLPLETVEDMLSELAASPGAQATVDLERQRVRLGGQEHAFEITPFRKDCLIAGTDQIGFTLGYEDSIERFEARLKSATPWV